MNHLHFRRFVVYPVLTHLGLWSTAAENLLMGTALHESGGLKFLDQVTGPNDVTLGPAFGVFQIEAATHADVVGYLARTPALGPKVGQMAAAVPSRELQLVTNLGYATAIARTIYWRRPEPLPAHDDVPGLAAYWKAFYNTPAGKGRVADWIDTYRRFHPV